MTNESVLAQILEQQIKEFFSSVDEIGYAASMEEYYKDDDRISKAWGYVKEVIRNPIWVEFTVEEGKNRISVINEVLGPDIALKLYRYYVESLSGGPPLNPMVPMFILSDDDFASMMRRSHISDEERLSLVTLQRETKEKRQYLERTKSQQQ